MNPFTKIENHPLSIAVENFEKEIPILESLKKHREYISGSLFIDSDGIPVHDCEFKTNPEKGACDFCEMWADGSAAIKQYVEI